MSEPTEPTIQELREENARLRAMLRSDHGMAVRAAQLALAAYEACVEERDQLAAQLARLAP